jgi:hypothetical protein
MKGGQEMSHLQEPKVWNPSKRDWDTITGNMSADEVELLSADIQDAIDGVLEDWGVK